MPTAKQRTAARKNIKKAHENRLQSLLRRQKLNLHLTARGFEVEVRGHKNPVALFCRKFHSERVHVGNLTFEFD